MRSNARVDGFWRRRVGICAFLLATALGVPAACGEDGKATGGDGAIVRLGAELFFREWMPDDPRSHGGDGLGPVYNDTSCVACHNLGAPGGGGPASKNVAILSAIDLGDETVQVFGLVKGIFKNRVAEPGKDQPPPPGTSKAGKKPNLDALAALHSGFRTARSVVLHRSGTDPSYQDWRRRLFESPETDGFPTPVAVPVPPQAQQRQTREDRATQELLHTRARAGMTSPFVPITARQGDFQLILTRRNPPPLFGSGLTDAIPEAVIEAGTRRADPDAPEIKGRVSRLPGGKIGRFGWKGQTADLNEFVLTACAVELGLEVTGHSQNGIPSAPHYKATGLDLNEPESAALVAFVRSLPAPAVRPASSRREGNAIKAGKDAFHAAGCAQCHVPNLGPAEGIYSDLLLHDLGDELSDNGVYGIVVPDRHAHEPVALGGQDPPGPGAKEWRTPPLWGFRDSGPYLHDGRAEDLEQAVAAHGGEAARSALRFFALSPRERLKIEGFLKTLTAPSNAAAAP